MRTHIFLALLTLFLGACASKENLSASKQAEIQERQERADFWNVDRTSSRIR